jgi:uncharacterized protein
MKDLGVGIALVLVFEGLLWALAPDTARRMVADMAKLPPAQLQRAAWGFVAAGCFMVWMVRG